MKKLGRGILAFFVGELVAIAHKDKQFQRDLKRKQGAEKWKYIFQSLFNFNKGLVETTHETLDGKLAEAKVWAQNEYVALEEKMHHFEENAAAWSQEKIQPYLNELETRFGSLKEQAKELVDEVDLETKIAAFKRKIAALKKKFIA